MPWYYHGSTLLLFDAIVKSQLAGRKSLATNLRIRGGILAIAPKKNSLITQNIMPPHSTSLYRRLQLSQADLSKHHDEYYTPRINEIVQALICFAKSQPDLSFLTPFFSVQPATDEIVEVAFNEMFDYHLGELSRSITLGEDDIAFTTYQLDRNKIQREKLLEAIGEAG